VKREIGGSFEFAEIGAVAKVMACATLEQDNFFEIGSQDE